MRVGVGPAAALPSALLGVLAWGLGERLGLAPLAAGSQLLATLGWSWLGLGCALLAWAVQSARAGQNGRRLVTTGAYRYLRHPQYAAFIWCLAPGLALLCHSYALLAWAAVQLPLWQALTKREELILEANLGQAYRDYAAGTGAFWPRWRDLLY